MMLNNDPDKLFAAYMKILPAHNLRPEDEIFARSIESRVLSPWTEEASRAYRHSLWESSRKATLTLTSNLELEKAVRVVAFDHGRLLEIVDLMCALPTDYRTSVINEIQTRTKTVETPRTWIEYAVWSRDKVVKSEETLPDGSLLHFEDGTSASILSLVGKAILTPGGKVLAIKTFEPFVPQNNLREIANE